MKLAVVASLIAGASAFAPSKVATRSTALNMAFEDELGVQVRPREQHVPLCSSLYVYKTNILVNLLSMYHYLTGAAWIL